jgi:hybrid cluster-associated redox disulfide protein
LAIRALNGIIKKALSRGKNITIKELKIMITKDTGIIEAVQSHPEIMEVFAEYGLGCIGCMAAHFETIGQGAGAHGIDVDALIEDINKVIAENEEAK